MDFFYRRTYVKPLGCGGASYTLQIDVEGAEFNILNSIDFNKIKVDNILFESKHFDGTFTEGKKLKIIKEKLVLNGFKLHQLDKENILAKKLSLI